MDAQFLSLGHLGLILYFICFIQVILHDSFESMLLIRAQLCHIIHFIIIAIALIRSSWSLSPLIQIRTSKIFFSIFDCWRFRLLSSFEIFEYLLWIIEDYLVLLINILIIVLLLYHFLLLFHLLLFSFHLLLMNKCIIDSVIQISVVICFVFSIQITTFLTEFH